MYNRRIHSNQGAIRRNNRSQFLKSPEIPDNEFNLKYLQDLFKKSSEELMEELVGKRRTELLERFQNDLPGDFYVATIRLFSKVCSSIFHKVKREILQTYLTEKFTKKITNFISTLPLQEAAEKKENKLFWSDPDSFWLNLAQICEHALNEVPNFAEKALAGVVKAAQMAVSELEKKHGLTPSEEIQLCVDNIRKRMDSITEEREKKKRELPDDEKKDKEPPDDFRQIDVYPTSAELLSNGRGFLRENVVKGPYRDVDHYLDVQFRLLREDFVAPLRKGIQGYLSNLRNGTNERLDSVAIYQKVRFVRPEMVNEDRCYRIKLDSPLQATDETSKSFMCGSLLVFTRDSSFQSLLFGRVAAWDKEEIGLRFDEIIAAFTGPVDVRYNTDYLMLESKVFFEPYFHVLTQLQRMSSDVFPLEKYIVKVDTKVDPVKYSKQITSLSKDLEKGLNHSQKGAFQAALGREIAIIQGPPGTGKTFLAKRIAHALLRNPSLWYNRSPILVICFTNHALDQFLEGMSRFTDRLVRVGGQSKSEALKEFHINSIKKREFEEKRSNCSRKHRFISDPVRDARQDYREISNETNNLTRALHYINSFEGIIVLDHIQALNTNNILNWLGGSDLTNQKPEDDQDVYDDDDDVPQLSNSNFIQEPFGDAKCSIFDVGFNIQQIAELKTKMRELTNKLEDDFFQKTYDALQRVKATISHRRKLHALFYEKLKTLRERNPSELTGNIAEEEDCVSLDDRWNFYLHHLNNYKETILQRIGALNRLFRRSYNVYAGLKEIEDTRILGKALVVGMTTTCAARMKSVLEALKSPIVIVEEAAEVLEAHITSALTEHCKHLILIGDHQQLKPSTADYSIEKKFKLGTSLFERMVINQIQCFTLNVQHRMKPEISALIAPTIYPNLQNERSVHVREEIRGVGRSLFFIDHRIHEQSTKTGTSKSNMHEVHFLICLARYFCLVGYKPENITILVTYLGQMYKMQNEVNRSNDNTLNKVRIAVLDNYQGEESKIILLSLVRSNAEGKIGFLATENRVCVALSRAKDGLFIIGNMAQLSKASEIWQKIHTTLKNGNNIGPALELQCGNHPDKKTLVKESMDFLKVPQGGCDQKCVFELTCGHKCTKFCHILDPNHTFFECKKNCEKLLCGENELHVCRKLCYEKCGKCTYLVEKKLPCEHTVSIECHEDPSVFKCPVLLPTTLDCGHSVDKPCHSETSTFPCSFPCAKIFPCGHSCSLTCHVKNDPIHLRYKCKEACKRHAKGCRDIDNKDHLCRKLCHEICDLCRIPVKKERTTCSHFYTVECNIDVDAMICKKPCKKTLDCGHKCKMMCHVPCQKCELRVSKTLPCKHEIQVKCWEEPKRELCKKNCSLTLACGHKCAEKCIEPCTSQCNVIVDFELTLPCNHQATKLPCHLANSDSTKETDYENEVLKLSYCREPCKEILKCGHHCSGSCSECFQGRMHKQCVKKGQISEHVIQENVENRLSLRSKYSDLKESYEQKNICK